MADYTALLRAPFDDISPEDDDFIARLLEVAKLFRPFSESLDGFLRAQGYGGADGDTEGKVAFLRAAFLRAGIEPPRELRLWYTRGQPIRRETAFQLCFAFGLDGNGTDAFFREVYKRERSFDCHQAREAVYYFCLNNGLTWADAQAILAKAPEPGEDEAESPAVFTGEIVAQLNRLETRAELEAWLAANGGLLRAGSATARRMIRRMWAEAAGPDGLLLQEHRRFLAIGDDAGFTRRCPPVRRACAPGTPIWPSSSWTRRACRSWAATARSAPCWPACTRRPGIPSPTGRASSTF